ncbi:MAG: hypothetical protein GY953_00085 [bacterium]|nr:hypothetical protein [bacterium]
MEKTQQADVNRRGGTGRDPSLGDAPDQVSLSGMSAQVKALGVDSPERIAKLEKLSADVAAGRYQVDPQAVSERLVDDAMKPLS